MEELEEQQLPGVPSHAMEPVVEVVKLPHQVPASGDGVLSSRHPAGPLPKQGAEYEDGNGNNLRLFVGAPGGLPNEDGDNLLAVVNELPGTIFCPTATALSPAVMTNEIRPCGPIIGVLGLLPGEEIELHRADRGAVQARAFHLLSGCRGEPVLCCKAESACLAATRVTTGMDNHGGAAVEGDVDVLEAVAPETAITILGAESLLPSTPACVGRNVLGLGLWRTTLVLVAETRFLGSALHFKYPRDTPISYLNQMAHLVTSCWNISADW